MSRQYDVHYSRRRTLALVVKNQQVSVKAPYGACRDFIADFVKSKQAWINKQLHKQSDIEAARYNPWLHRRIMLFGQLRAIEVSESSLEQADKQTINIVISKRVKHRRRYFNQQLLALMHDELSDYLSERIMQWQKVMNIAANGISVKVYKRRWGSCDSRGELCFNTLLAGAPHWVIDYVIVHELAHRVHMDHSHQFWALVNGYYKHTDQARLWLKENAHLLDFVR